MSPRRTLTEITITPYATLRHPNRRRLNCAVRRMGKVDGHVGNLPKGLHLMNKIMRILGTTTATLALGLGGSALPATAAAPSSGSWDHSSSDNKRHEEKDFSRHDNKSGWWDGEDRWHNWSDRSGWRDDKGNWRSDHDDNGSWTGRDGCRHDKDGWWDHEGQRHHHDNNKHDRAW